MLLAADENFNGRILRALQRRLTDLDIVRVQDTERSGKAMSAEFQVVAYAGYQGEQEPLFLVRGDERLGVEIRGRWREPDARCFRVDAGGRVYLLRCRLPELEWIVESPKGVSR